MDHLGTSVGLLVVVGNRHGIKLADWNCRLQECSLGISRLPPSLSPPGSRRSSSSVPRGRRRLVTNCRCCHGLPRHPVPVLHRGVLDPRAFHGNELDDGGMKLVRRASARCNLKVANIAAFIRHYQGASELAGIRSGLMRNSAESIGTARPRNVNKGPAAEHGSNLCRIEVVGIGYYRAEILLG